MLLSLSLLSLNSKGDVSFTLLKQQVCINENEAAYTVGQQYVDQNNGVPDDQWSMLTRWQGFKGHQSFVNCESGELNINTWQIPHHYVVGGGYNDMFGYSWSSAGAPSAFMDTPFKQADLILQVYATVPKLLQHLGTGPRSVTPVVNITLFAYLVDVTHPELHPIAVLGLIAQNNQISTGGGHGYDYPGGVWFSYFSLDAHSRYNEYDDFGNVSHFIDNNTLRNIEENFYRMRVSPQAWINTITDINNDPCTDCPAKGYSLDPKNYKLKYGGIIAEVSTWDISEGTLGDLNKDQINLGVQFRYLGIYRRVVN